MKKIIPVSFLCVIILLSIFSAGVTSCTKEKIVIDTLTQIQNDTIIVRDTISKDTALTLEILTANPWKLEQIQGVQGGAIVSYTRGNPNYTANFDKEYIVFNSNKTGTYYDPNGYPSDLTWDFGNSENTKIIYTVNFPTPGPTVVNWENIVYRNKSLSIDQYWSQGSVHAHAQLIRTPK